MRGADDQAGAMFSYVSLEDRVPQDHPLRAVRRITDRALERIMHVALNPLAIALLGRPTSVWARLARLGSDFANGDTLSITLGFEGGATALLSAVLAY